MYKRINMGFIYNDIEYQIANDITNGPLHRQNAMVYYVYIKPYIIGMKTYTFHPEIEPYNAYLILCKINNILEWVEVEVLIGEKIIKNQID
jgi:hypothetical protein